MQLPQELLTPRNSNFLIYWSQHSHKLGLRSQLTHLLALPELISAVSRCRFRGVAVAIPASSTDTKECRQTTTLLGVGGCGIWSYGGCGSSGWGGARFGGCRSPAVCQWRLCRGYNGERFRYIYNTLDWHVVVNFSTTLLVKFCKLLCCDLILSLPWASNKFYNWLN